MSQRAEKGMQRSAVVGGKDKEADGLFSLQCELVPRIKKGAGAPWIMKVLFKVKSRVPSEYTTYKHYTAVLNTSQVLRNTLK